jgi:hypothetical protein
MQSNNQDRTKEARSPVRPTRKTAVRPERTKRSPRLAENIITASSPSVSEASTVINGADTGLEHTSTPVVRVAPPNWNGSTKFANFAANPKVQLSPLNTTKPLEAPTEPSPQTPRISTPPIPQANIPQANIYMHSPHSGSTTDEKNLEYSAFEGRRNPSKMTILRTNGDKPDLYNKQSNSFFGSMARGDTSVLRDSHSSHLNSPDNQHKPHNNNEMFSGLADLAFYSVPLEKLNSQGKFQKRLLRFDGNILLIMSKTVESTKSRQKLIEFDLMESSHSLVSHDLQSYIRNNYPAGLQASLAKVILSKGSSNSPDPTSTKYHVPKVLQIN